MKEPHIIVLRMNRNELAFWPERDGRTHEILDFADRRAAIVHATAAAKYDKQSKFFIAATEEL